jgi:hypothetical protein
MWNLNGILVEVLFVLHDPLCFGCHLIHVVKVRNAELLIVVSQFTLVFFCLWNESFPYMWKSHGYVVRILGVRVNVPIPCRILRGVKEGAGAHCAE